MSRFAILRGSPMFGWKRTLYKKRSRELSQCLGAFLSISLVASSPFFFFLVEVNQRRCERVGLLLRLCLGYISFVCLPFSLCLVRFDIEYAPVSVHPKSIGDVRCDKL